MIFQSLEQFAGMGQSNLETESTVYGCKVYGYYI